MVVCFGLTEAKETKFYPFLTLDFFLYLFFKPFKHLDPGIMKVWDRTEMLFCLNCFCFQKSWCV